MIEQLIALFFAQFEQGNHKEAIQILERVLEIQTKELGEYDPAIAVTFTYMAEVLTTAGKFNQAMEKCNRALKIQLKTLGEKHVDTANSYEAIGHIFMHQGKNKKAEEMHRKALGIKQEFLPPNHPELMDLYQYLGLSLQKQAKFSEATKMYKRLLAKQLEIHGEDHQSVVVSYNAIAGLLKDQNRLDDALQMIEKGVEICNRLQRGNIDKSIMGATLNNKAKYLFEQGKFEAAAEIFNKVLIIRIETLDEMHPYTGTTYEELGTTYMRHGKVDSAIKAYEGAIKIRRKDLGNNHAGVRELVGAVETLKRDKAASTLNDQGLAMKAQGDSEKAIQLFQKALHIYKTTCQVHHNIAPVYENISAVRVDQGLLQDAVDASAEALKIRRRTRGDDDAETKKRMEVHKSLLRQALANRS